MRQRANRSNRLGFTLAEVLVTVTIIAVLAAVVVPSIGGTLFKGDVGRVTSDLTNLRGGMEQFLTDTHRYPGQVADLTTAITGSGSDALSSTYDATAIARWKGPYMNTASLKTGFGGSIAAGFVKVDCTTASASITTTTCLAVQVNSILNADAQKIALAMTGDANTLSSTTSGALRMPGAALLYLALPVQ